MKSCDLERNRSLEDDERLEDHVGDLSTRNEKQVSVLPLSIPFSRSPQRRTHLISSISMFQRKRHAPRDVPSLSLQPSQATRESSTSEFPERSFPETFAFVLFFRVGGVDGVVALRARSKRREGSFEVSAGEGSEWTRRGGERRNRRDETHLVDEG